MEMVNVLPAGNNGTIELLYMQVLTAYYSIKLIDSLKGNSLLRYRVLLFCVVFSSMPPQRWRQLATSGCCGTPPFLMMEV
jgi:hypothetical protein